MALLIDHKAYMLSTFTTVFLNGLSVQRPVSALIFNDARQQCRSGSAYWG